MTSSRLIRLSALSLLLVVVAACNKEPQRPVTPSSPPSAPAPQPSPAPAVPATPSAGAPATSPSSGASSGGTQEAEQLASKSGCLACHSVEKKIVGPAYKDVAAKYRGQPDAEAKLAQKVKNGGAGVWGQVPMPPNAQVSDADIKRMVEWIISLK